MKLRIRLKRKAKEIKSKLRAAIETKRKPKVERKLRLVPKKVAKEEKAKLEQKGPEQFLQFQALPISQLGLLLPSLAMPREKKKPSVELVELPKISEDVKLPEFEEEEKLTVTLTYPLVKLFGKVFAYARIFFDRRLHQFVYHVIEPRLNEEERKALHAIKEFIREKIDVDFSKLKEREAINYITQLFEEAASYFRIPREIREKLLYYVIRDLVGLERIEPLMRDGNLEDISCDGVGIPIYVYHRDPRFASMPTNIVFETSEELDNFVMKLAERCGKTISLASPLLDATLPSGDRVQATLASDIARRGSNFTIRRFTEKPLTPVDLLLYGTTNLAMMAYFWLAVEYGCSILVAGGVASGKTTMLNVLSMFIRPQAKIVSIEDTAELRLAHPHWIPHVARVPIAIERREVDLFELLRASLRQRPDYLILGEVRGREAYVLFQQMALGHPTLATIHAENMEKLVDRLTTPPISLPASLLRNLDLVIFMGRVRKNHKQVRRVMSVDEIIGFEPEQKKPLINRAFEWLPLKDEFASYKSALLAKFARRSGKRKEELKDELMERAKVLLWMVRKGIRDYRQVSRVVARFYSDKESLLNIVEAEV